MIEIGNVSSGSSWSKRAWRTISSLVWCGAIGLAAGCSSPDASSPAEREVKDLHRMFNNEEFQDIYASAAPDLKAATSPTRFVTFLSSVKQAMGPFHKAELQGVRITTGTRATTVVSFRTRFEKGAGVETFIFSNDGPKPALAGYYINSPLVKGEK